MKKTLEITVDIPDWANWLAVDEDGTVCIFKCKPHIRNTFWDFTTKEPTDIDYAVLFKMEYFPKGWDWTKTLRRLKDYR